MPEWKRRKVTLIIEFNVTGSGSPGRAIDLVSDEISPTERKVWEEGNDILYVDPPKIVSATIEGYTGAL